MIKCIMCGEKKAEKRIWSPNYDDDSFWDVCYDCERFIQDAKKKSIEEIIKYHKNKLDAEQKESEMTYEEARDEAQERTNKHLKQFGIYEESEVKE